MYAERMILETDSSGKIISLPKLPPNKQVEAIFLVVDVVDVADVVDNKETEKLSLTSKRTPHPDIAGKLKINGDLFSTVSAADWEFSS